MAKAKVTALAAPRVEEPWERELREKAAKARSNESLGVPRVTYKGGVLSIDGKAVAEKRLRIVPLALCYGKEWYEHEYTQGSNDTPGCYAFGEGSDKGLLPHAQAPKKQAESCDACPHNAFGTAEKGRGKRCSDKRRVLFLLADDLARAGKDPKPEEWSRAVAKAQMYQIAIPPGSLRGFGQYLASLKDATPHESMQEAVTEVTTEPSPNGAFIVVFTFLDAVPPARMPALLKRAEGGFGLIAQPFPVIAQEEAAPRQVKGQGRRK